MTKVLKIASIVGIALALLFGVLLFAFYHLIQVGEFRRFLISEFEKRTQLKVEVGEAELQMGRVVGISFRDFTLLEPDSTHPMMTAQKILIRVALLPLLERKMIFNEIRFHQPAFQVVRDESGKVPLLDLMVSFLFQKQKEVQFTLDLREIRFEKGHISFLDHRGEQDPIVTHLREIDLNLRRIPAKGFSRSGSQVPIEVADHGEGEPALEFSFKAAIEKDGKKVGFLSKGKVLFPKEGFELRQAWFDADMRVEALPTALFWDYYGQLLPIKAMHGTLGSRLRWQGSLAKRVHVKGEIDFKRLAVDASDIFAGELAPGDGRLVLEMELGPQEIRFSRFDLRSQEITLAGQGAVRFLEKDCYLEVRLATPFLPLQSARKYIPLKILNSPAWGQLVHALNQGELRLTKAEVSGRLSQLRQLEPGFENHIGIDAEVRRAGGDVEGDRYLPIRGVSGRFVLEKGILYYKGVHGYYGQSYLAEVEGSHKGVLRDRGLLELRVRGEVDLGELREQLKMGLLPAQADKVTANLNELGGKGKIGLFLREDFASQHHYEGQLSLENARLQIGDISLTQVRGDLSVSPDEIRAERVTALLSGSPLHIQVTLRNYLSDGSVFDLKLDSPGVKAGDVSRILFSRGSPTDPGTVRGNIRYQGPMNSTKERVLSGSLELAGVRLPLRPFTQPLQDLSGKVRFDERGIDFLGLKGRLAGSEFDFTGQWRDSERPQMVFSLVSPVMDLGHLLSQIDSVADEWYDRLQAKGRVRINKGRYKGFEFSELGTDLVLEKRVWRLDNFSARSLGGTVHGNGYFIDDPKGLRFSVEPKVQGVPVQGFLGWFDIGTREITGNVNLAGKLESSGETGTEIKRNLSGNFQLEIKDGVARRMQLLVRILSLVDLTRWFSFQLPDFNQKGIRFRSVTGDFKVDKGIYSTENFLVDSDDISITGAGQFDGPNEVIDAVVALRPFPRMGSIVSYIPLIGPGIAAIKDSIMVASFRVQGPVEEAIITPAPLSTLSEFFFSALKIPQRLITLPGAEKK